MTLREALERRIPRVRLHAWANPECYLRLPLLAGGMHGPWAELYDAPTQGCVLDIRPGSQRVPMFEIDDEGGYEEYRGEASPWEWHPDAFARAYEDGPA